MNACLPCPARRCQKGAALVLVMVMMAFMAGITIVVLDRSRSEQLGTEALRQSAAYDALAEAGTEYAIRYIANSIAGYRKPDPSGTVTIGGVPVTYQIVYLGPPDDPVSGKRSPSRAEISDPNTGVWSAYSGSQSGYIRYVYPYRVTATVNYSQAIGMPGTYADTSMPASTINKILDFNAQPLFQFLSFFGSQVELEITTGPNSIFSGRLHANKSMYIGNGQYSTGAHQIYNTNYLRTAGQLRRARYDDYQNQDPAYNRATGGGLWVKKFGLDGAVKDPLTANYRTNPPVKPDNSPGNYASFMNRQDANAAGIPNHSGLDSLFNGFDQNNDGDFLDTNDKKGFDELAMNLWGGTVKTGSMGVKPLSVPDVGSIQSYVHPQDHTATFDLQISANVENASETIDAALQLRRNGTALSGAAAPKGHFRALAETEGIVVVTKGTENHLFYKGQRIPKSQYTSGGTYNGLLTQATTNEKREGINIKQTVVDVAKLNQFVRDRNGGAGHANSDGSSGLLVYMFNADTLSSYLQTNVTIEPDKYTTVPKNAPAVRDGFRLTNGQQLATGMTFVTEDPVYIHGDFNTGYPQKWSQLDTNNNGTIDAGEVANINAGTTAALTANGVTNPVGLKVDSFINKAAGDINQKKGSAVIADAINLLSNNWAANHDQTNQGQGGSDSDYTNRTAKPTIYNCAIFGGMVPSRDADPRYSGLNTYSGGLENYPRFHERWTSKTARYRGSFVNLYKSRIAYERWGKGSVYSPPNRNWEFDTDFEDVNKLPPFSPLSVGASRVVWWK